MDKELLAKLNLARLLIDEVCDEIRNDTDIMLSLSDIYGKLHDFIVDRERENDAAEQAD